MSILTNKKTGDKAHIDTYNSVTTIRFVNPDENLCCHQLSQDFNKDELRGLVNLLLQELQTDT